MNPFYAGVRTMTLQGGAPQGFVRAVGGKDVPFEIRRVFYIYGKGNVGQTRGRHSNRKSEFVLFNVRGSCTIKTIDENGAEAVYSLCEPNQAVYLPRMVWKEMYDFTEDSVLMVLTNEPYDAGEYIRSFDVFAAEMKAMDSENGESVS